MYRKERKSVSEPFKKKEKVYRKESIKKKPTLNNYCLSLHYQIKKHKILFFDLINRKKRILFGFYVKNQIITNTQPQNIIWFGISKNEYFLSKRVKTH